MKSAPFDPAWAATLAPLALSARFRVDGLLAGRHASPRRGRSGEFQDRRAYAPGDDSRRIDWKVFARTDRWTFREEREDTTLRAGLFLDVSRSMAYAAESRPPKSLFASRILAALAYLLLHRGEAAGVGFLDQRLTEYHPPRSGADQLNRILALLERPAEGDKSDFARALREAARRLTRKGIAVVVSDFLGPVENVLQGFRFLRAARQDAIALQVLDPSEVDLAIKGGRIFEDLESGDRLAIDPALVEKAYRERMAARQIALARGLAALNVDYFLFSTARPPEEQVARFLRRRATMSHEYRVP